MSEGIFEDTPPGQARGVALGGAGASAWPHHLSISLPRHSEYHDDKGWESF